MTPSTGLDFFVLANTNELDSHVKPVGYNNRKKMVLIVEHILLTSRAILRVYVESVSKSYS